ncbi:AAA family ATPase [Streptomyces sp. SID5474]|nr:AAA family ATPase [Streptomyces sp. SID5474]
MHPSAARVATRTSPRPATRGGSGGGSDVTPDAGLGVEEARKRWARVVGEAAAGARITLHAPHGVRAVLGPPSEDVVAAQGELPTFTMTAARQGLGDLVRSAAAGTPQLLLRYRSVYAQITHATVTPAVHTTPEPVEVAPLPSAHAAELVLDLDLDTHRSAAPPRPAPGSAAGRRIAGFAEALHEAGTVRRRAVSFGVAALDEALGGGALPGRLLLVVGAPGAGAGLLAAGTVRCAASASARFGEDATPPGAVLLCTPGRPRAEIAARLTAAAAGVDHQRLRAGTLTEEEQRAADAASSRLAGGGLLLDDGQDLTLDILRETATDIENPRLIVLDALNHILPEPCGKSSTAGSAGSTTAIGSRSGPDAVALGSALSALRRLAADLDVPVVAVWEQSPTRTEDMASAFVEADTVVHLTRDSDQAFAIVSERDLGPIAQAALHADLGRVRFTDARPVPSAVVPPALPRPTTTAAREAAAGDSTPAEPTTGEPPAAAADIPPAPDPDAEPTAPQKEPVSAAPEPTPPAAAPGRTAAPRSPALKRPTTPRPGRVVVDTDEDPLPGAIADAVARELVAAEGDVEAAAQALARRAIPDVMELLRLARAGSRYEHTWYPPLPDLLRKRSKEEADAVWEARPKWRNTSLPPGEHEVVALDMNAAYLSALKAHLPIGPLEHRVGPDLDDFDGPRGRKRRHAGIYLVDPPAWPHDDLPNPLGDRDEPGPLWITDPTLRLLLRCASPAYGNLCEPPRVLESWTAVATENLLERLRTALRDARDAAIAEGDDVTLDYVKQMYAKLVSTMGGSNYNREINRPDWMHIIRSQAFANLWVKAFKARQAGLTVVRVMGTDELHLTGGDWRTVFTEGRGVADVKVKDAYILETKERK